ncbi:MAG: biotin/lipoyl-binding protein [Anaerolineales bacterium]|nr:biotin/lipoyl-binding protein [Anaerolineales bacterium]
MKQRLTVNGQVYEVHIENLRARPIVATVNGQRFEILTENDEPAQIKQAAKENPIKTFAQNPSLDNARSLTAPLPGTVVEVLIQEGDAVQAGQTAFVIEAMKMKNSIRVARDGVIKKIFANAGQSVTHKQALAEFEE